MHHAIVLEGIHKAFGQKIAVDHLDLRVPAGSMTGFIGPNGAGKTTTIRMIMSILFPDEGRISVLGNASALEAKDRIGYLPEERGVYKKMKVGAFLRYMGRLKGLDQTGLAHTVRSWLERVGLSDVEKTRCEELSKGMQQKVQFIAAVIHEPDLLILDEPFSGLDPINMRLLRDLVFEQHQRGTTIVFSTHVMFQAEQLCEHVVMINNGHKVLDDSIAAIRANHDPRTILFEPMNPSTDLAPLHALECVEEIVASNGHWQLALADGCPPPDAIQAIAAAIPPARIELQRPTLEDVFVSMVRDSSALQGQDAAALRASVRSDTEPVEALR